MTKNEKIREAAQRVVRNVERYDVEGGTDLWRGIVEDAADLKALTALPEDEPATRAPARPWARELREKWERRLKIGALGVEARMVLSDVLRDFNERLIFNLAAGMEAIATEMDGAPAPSAPTTAATEERFVLASPTQAYPCTNPYHSTSGCVGRERECYTVRPAPADEGTDE